MVGLRQTWDKARRGPMWGMTVASIGDVTGLVGRGQALVACRPLALGSLILGTYQHSRLIYYTSIWYMECLVMLPIH
jgi:hypothetical protein